ncbi:MAG: hypothetical protein ABH837_02165, partial [bacterium]
MTIETERPGKEYTDWKAPEDSKTEEKDSEESTTESDTETQEQESQLVNTGRLQDYATVLAESCAEDIKKDEAAGELILKEGAEEEWDSYTGAYDVLGEFRDQEITKSQLLEMLQKKLEEENGRLSTAKESDSPDQKQITRHEKRIDGLNTAITIVELDIRAP